MYSSDSSDLLGGEVEFPFTTLYEKYTIVRYIGHGSTGRVYLCENLAD